MYSDLTTLFLYAVRNIVVLGSCVAMIIVSILIIANKTSSTKILGIGYLVAGLVELANQCFNLLLRYGDMESVVIFSTVLGIAGFIGNLALNLCISIFLHKNYGKKFVYIPLMLLPVAAKVADYLVRVLINSSSASGTEMGYWMLMTSVINGFVTGTAVAVIIIVILYMNSKKEQVIPKAWILRIVTLLWSFTMTGFNIFNYGTMLASHAADDKAVKNALSNMVVSSDTVYLMLEIIGSLVMLIIPIYILAMASKASKKAALAAE